MFALLLLFSMALFLSCIIWLIVSLFKKKTKKRPLMGMATAVILFSISVINIPVNTNHTSSETENIVSSSQIETSSNIEDKTTADINDTSNIVVEEENSDTIQEVAPSPVSAPPAVQETVAPAKQTTARTYVGNASTGKFHYPSCAAAKRIKPGNLVYLASRDEAVNSGYVPCGKCNP